MLLKPIGVRRAVKVLQSLSLNSSVDNAVAYAACSPGKVCYFCEIASLLGTACCLLQQLACLPRRALPLLSGGSPFKSIPSFVVALSSLHGCMLAAKSHRCGCCSAAKLTLYIFAARSYIGCACSQSALIRIDKNDGSQCLLAFFMSLSASAVSIWLNLKDRLAIRPS